MRARGRIETVGDVYAERSALEYSVDEFLRRRGWIHSNRHPGALWLWSKMLGRRRYTCEKATALILEQYVLARSVNARGRSETVSGLGPHAGLGAKLAPP